MNKYIFVLIMLICSNTFGAKKQTFWSLTIEGIIKDKINNVPLFYDIRNRNLQPILESINKAKSNPKINGIILKINSPITDFAKLQEIIQAIKNFKAKGKTVYVYSETLSNNDYLLASAANKIFISPQGGVEIKGIAIELLFMKDTLDMLGIEPNFYQVGTHKSAAENFTRSKASKYQKESINLLLDGIHNEMIKLISKSRSLPISKVKKLIDKGYFTPKEAKQSKLIDGYLYEDLFQSYINKKGIIVIPQKQTKKRFSIYQIFKGLRKKTNKTNSTNKIAIVFAQGAIISGKSRIGLFSRDSISSDNYIKIFRKLRKNKSIKAVIVRIDSPGGSALASDVIWREIVLLSKVKPVIASLSGIAASGGYYIAMACPTIVANPTSITGSIGVVGGKFNFKGLYDKIGFKKEIFKRGKKADLFSDYRSWTKEESQLIKKQMKYVYNSFVSKVAKQRNIPYKKMLNLAQGKVYTGRQALKVGLIDKLGGLYKAITIARQKAKDDKNQFKIVSYPKTKSFIDLLKGNINMQNKTAIELWKINSTLSKAFNYYLLVNKIFQKERVALFMPFIISYK